ncbi:MAG: AAA family ATPase [Melioribacteraceae bacterium]|nr:AAA family ATPase [Melioribacteraceae bacterium]
MKIKKLEIINYRTIENIEISFESYYTAICGKNDSGKSNIIRTILNLLDFVRYSDRINYENDYPTWKISKSKEDIVISLTMQFYAKTDSGLIRFINLLSFEGKSKLEQEIEINDIELTVGLNISPINKKSSYKIKINGKELTDSYRAKEILRRIQNTQLILFHNSTLVERRFRGNHGYVENLSNAAKEKIGSKIRSIQNEISKVVDKHRNELQSLLGILQDRYQVDLSFSSFDFNINRIPYEIYLGEKNREMPLDMWGSGTKNRTLILSSIFNAKSQINYEDETNKSTPVIIIEEPEAFLHPLAQAEFGRALQALSTELQIQIISTTHSPYLLSHQNPKSNILVKRKTFRNKLRETFLEKVDDINWREPFELALGMIGPEFDSLKNAFFSVNNKILLVEGDIDKAYFELLKKEDHKDKKLLFDGDIFSYDGFGFLTSTKVLEFIKNRFKNVIITLDLDASHNVASCLEKSGFRKDIDYFLVGIDKPGKRNIEGLLPKNIVEKVNKKNSSLVQALFSENKDEIKSAKSALKKLYLEEFKYSAEYTEEYYGEFYKIIKKINLAFKAT